MAPLLVIDAVSSQPEPGATTTYPASVELVAVKHYLNFPIGNAQPVREVSIYVDSRLVQKFRMALSDGTPDWWAPFAIDSWEGHSITIKVDPMHGAAKALAQIDQTDEPKAAADLYREPLRPQIHFSPRRGWIGDPNGLVYDHGEYHLFFQYNPFGVQWGNMHWGHAVSTDLVHWKERPIAIYPFKPNDWPFSGSAVVDEANTAGFRKGPDEPIVIIYPSTGRGLCLAYSTDRGRTFTEYAGNPLSMGNSGGDPRVIWDQAHRQWVMITSKRLVNVIPGTPDWLIKSKCGFDFFTSLDLKNWTHQSRIEDYWECPDLFELPIDGDKGRTKWVVLSNQTPSLSAGGRYVIGSFDGKRFTEETGKLQFNFGNAYGAAQSYNHIPAEDGRRINLGCAFGMKTPGMPFGQMMDFPTELSLRTTDEGLRLCATPIKEIETLYSSTRRMDNIILTPEGTALPGVSGDLLDLSAQFLIGADTTQIGLNIRGVPVTFDAKGCELRCLDRTAPLRPVHRTIKLRVLVDRTSIEIFANDGRIYMPMAVTFTGNKIPISLFAQGGGATVTALTVHTLKSAWDQSE